MAGSSDKAVEGTSKAQSRKVRTAMSCDRCKSRKTKCKNPVPGPCDYCRSIKSTCQIDAGKRKQRPYYFVSEEEFRLMNKVLKRCFPDRKLDVVDLRDILSQLESKARNGSDAVSLPILPPAKTESLSPRTVQKPDSEQQAAQEGVMLEEIASLHEDLGCMMRDPSGEYRYIGANSGISFNAAVRDLHPDSIASKPNKDIIPGMTTITNASTTPPADSTLGSIIHSEIHLPPQELAFHYVQRYFRDIHCLYWLYSTDQFYDRLESTFSSRAPSTASWICSLYSIFAIGSMKSTDETHGVRVMGSSNWLAMAKELVPRICDEADLDSIRALILLALALKAHCFSNNAYLHVGIAVRIGFSLGLHVDKYSLSHGHIEREIARRIWWTLYIYDKQTALSTGKPCAIAKYGLKEPPPLPSESVLVSDSYTPRDYLQVSAGLTRLTKETSHTLYVEPMSGVEKLVFPRVMAILANLQEWANNVPSHLSRTTQVVLSHRRPVALLHARYWSVVILATRPFLLCSVLRHDRIQDTQKRRCYDELSNICIDAAQRSLRVLQMMADESLLTSLIPSEFNYVLQLIQIFLVAFARDQSDAHIAKVRTGLSILESMDDIGWTARARPEVINQLRECGVLDEGSDYANSIQDFTNFLIGANDTIDSYDMISAGYQSDAHTAGYQTLAMAEMDFGDTPASEALLQQVSNLSRMPPFSTA